MKAMKPQKFVRKPITPRVIEAVQWFEELGETTFDGFLREGSIEKTPDGYRLNQDHFGSSIASGTWIVAAVNRPGQPYSEFFYETISPEELAELWEPYAPGGDARITEHDFRQKTGGPVTILPRV